MPHCNDEQLKLGHYPALGIVLIWESSPEPRLKLLRIDHAAKTDGAGAVTSRRHQ